MRKTIGTAQVWMGIVAEKCKRYIKPAFLLFAIYLTGIFAILRANYKYIDDYGRVFEGYKGWDDFSRFTSVILSPFIHADNYLTDISPLPQILACVLLSAAGIISIRALANRENAKISVWQIIAIVPMGLSPYFLECLSYKYDSVYMALSVFAAVLPIVLVDAKFMGFLILTIVGTVLMLTTYQASSGIFPMLLAAVVSIKWSQKEDIKSIGKKLLTGAGGYLIGMGIYKIFIMKEVDEYVSSSVAPVNEIINQFIKYYRQVGADFKSWWILLILLVIVFFIVTYVIESRRNKLASFGMALATSTILALLAFGMYPVLSKASYYPRAMYGFGVMVAFFAVGAVHDRKLWLARIFTIAFSWTCFVFSMSYGNALAEQARYTEFRVTSVVNDIKELDMMKDDETVLVQISGSIGKSPVIRNVPQSNYTILERLIPETFAQDWKWSKYYFYNYFDMKNITEDRLVDLHDSNLPMISDSIYHTIYGGDHKILIELK